MRALAVLSLVVVSGCATASMERFRAGSRLNGFPLDHLVRPFEEFHEEQNRSGNAVTRAPYSELGGWVAVLVPTTECTQSVDAMLLKYFIGENDEVLATAFFGCRGPFDTLRLGELIGVSPTAGDLYDVGLPDLVAIVGHSFTASGLYSTSGKIGALRFNDREAFFRANKVRPLDEVERDVAVHPLDPEYARIGLWSTAPRARALAEQIRLAHLHNKEAMVAAVRAASGLDKVEPLATLLASPDVPPQSEVLALVKELATSLDKNLDQNDPKAPLVKLFIQNLGRTALGYNLGHVESFKRELATCVGELGVEAKALQGSVDSRIALVKSDVESSPQCFMPITKGRTAARAALVVELETEGDRLFASGALASAAVTWKKIALLDEAENRGYQRPKGLVGPVVLERVAGKIARVVSGLCEAVIPEVLDEKGTSLAPLLTALFVNHPCDGVQLRRGTSPLRVVVDEPVMEWRVDKVLDETRELKVAEQTAEANPAKALNDQTVAAMEQRLRRAYQAEEEAQARGKKAGKTVVGRGMIQSGTGPYGFTVSRSEGQQTFQAERDEAQAKQDEKAARAEITQLTEALKLAQSGTAPSATVTVTKNLSIRYPVETQYFNGPGKAVVHLLGGSAPRELTVNTTFLVTEGSRSPGVPERGLRAWNQFFTPTQLRAKAVEQVKKEALKGSLPLLRVEMSGRVAQLLKDTELRGSSSTAELAMLSELFRMVP